MTIKTKRRSDDDGKSVRLSAHARTISKSCTKQCHAFIDASWALIHIIVFLWRSQHVDIGVNLPDSYGAEHSRDGNKTVFVGPSSRRDRLLSERRVRAISFGALDAATNNPRKKRFSYGVTKPSASGSSWRYETTCEMTILKRLGRAGNAGGPNDEISSRASAEERRNIQWTLEALMILMTHAAILRPWRWSHAADRSSETSSPPRGDDCAASRAVRPKSDQDIAVRPENAAGRSCTPEAQGREKQPETVVRRPHGRTERMPRGRRPRRRVEEPKPVP